MSHPDTAAAVSVSAFCRAHGFSRALFYKLVREGKGPKLIKAGRRTLVSIEAAEAWRKEMEDGASHAE